MSKMRKNLILFFNSLYLSTFCFGGGYIIMAFLEKIFVLKYNWFTKDEIAEIITLAQATPGSNSVNSNLLIGYRTNGIIGACFSLMGAIIPPLIIISIISVFYEQFISNAVVLAILTGMQCGIVAILIMIFISMSKIIFKEKNYFAIVIFPTCFILSYYFNIGIIVLFIPCIILGLSVFFYKSKKNLYNNKTDFLNHNEMIVNLKTTEDDFKILSNPDEGGEK